VRAAGRALIRYANRLPTWDSMLGKALEELTASREKPGKARDWLNSD
jgi:hypothetical protein